MKTNGNSVLSPALSSVKVKADCVPVEWAGERG